MALWVLRFEWDIIYREIMKHQGLFIYLFHVNRLIYNWLFIWWDLDILGSDYV